MALEIKKDEKSKPDVADRNLFLSRDKSAIVEEGHPDAGFVLTIAGNPISDVAKEHMKRLGVDKLPDAPAGDDEEEEVEEEEHDPENPEAPPKKVRKRRKKAK